MTGVATNTPTEGQVASGSSSTGNRSSERLREQKRSTPSEAQSVGAGVGTGEDDFEGVAGVIPVVLESEEEADSVHPGHREEVRESKANGLVNYLKLALADIDEEAKLPLVQLTLEGALVKEAERFAPLLLDMLTRGQDSIAQQTLGGWVKGKSTLPSPSPLPPVSLVERDADASDAVVTKNSKMRLKHIQDQAKFYSWGGCAELPQSLADGGVGGMTEIVVGTMTGMNVMELQERMSNLGRLLRVLLKDKVLPPLPLKVAAVEAYSWMLIRTQEWMSLQCETFPTFALSRKGAEIVVGNTMGFLQRWVERGYVGTFEDVQSQFEEQLEQARKELNRLPATGLVPDKEKPCFNFLRDACTFGSNCKYSHEVKGQ